MKPSRVIALCCLLAGGVASAQTPANPKGGTPPPSDAECLKLPAVKAPFAFRPGEELEFDVDAMGANAGKLFLRAQPVKNGLLPIEVEAKTNTLFAKVRRVSGGGTSFLSPKDLHPVRYVEDTTENEVRKTAEVNFNRKTKKAHIKWSHGNQKGQHEYGFAHDGLDLAGAMYLIRHLPMAEKKKVCFDAYGIRRMWRVDATVEAREDVSLPIGEFKAWHLSGLAIRKDRPSVRRELHIWISDDPRRLPLVAVGMIDLGAVRATLTRYSRPGEETAKAEGKEDLKW